MDNLSIVIPAYNEEKRIGKTLEAYGAYFERLRKERKIEYKIIVVINNTTDNTEKIVKIYSNKNNNITYLNFKQGGKGFAIIEGFKESLKDKENNLIGFVDADMATSPEAFYDLVKNIGQFDGIMASRYVRGAIVNPKQTIQRVFVSRVFNTLIRVLFFMPYRDTQCGAKIFKREAIEQTISKMRITQWAFDIDLLYQLRKKNFKIKEHPTVWADKEYSKINFMSAGPKMALAVIKLRIKNSIFRFILNSADIK